MKPVAFLYTTDQGNGSKYLSFSPPEAQDPDQLAEQEVCVDRLYTADQRREAQVESLMKAVALVDLRAGRTIRRLIAELEKADAIRGLA